MLLPFTTQQEVPEIKRVFDAQIAEPTSQRFAHRPQMT